MASWTYKTTWVYKKLYSGLDPLQCTSMPDCYLISALSALAWVCRMNIQNPDASGNVTLKIGGKDYVAAKTEELPVDAAGNLRSARSAGANETWPAIYEKLYARFLGVSPDPDSKNNPDVCNQMPKDGNALTTLADITAWAPNSEVSGNYQKIFDNLTADSKVKYPVVAWTYPTLEGIQTGYAVMPKHAYSVLGTYIEGATKYIVLRNPLGAVAQNAGITMKTAGNWAYKDRCYKRNATEFVGVYIGGIPPARNLAFNLAQGLFALEVGEFAKYF
ncbi:MAG: C2 family cysteine protease, partial [Methanomicrobiales archaeon]|nr:C2 family cysteine protease [Methanomicrobiales archaeon]